MKIFLFGQIFFLIESQASAHSWQNIHDGVWYAKIDINNGQRSITLHTLKIDPKKILMRPILTKDTKTVKQMANKQNAVAAINANFFDAQDKPLGLVVMDGREALPKKEISWWGVFCVKSGRASIMHSSSYRKGLCDQAVQAGPRLVINGWIPKLKEEVSRKTAVGVTRKNEVVIAVSVENIPITQLAKIFRQPEHQGGLETLNALNLDGGTSSQLYIRTNQLTLTLPNFIPVPVGLGIFAK